MHSNEISIQLYTVREALAHDFEATIKRIASLGYTNIEPYDFVRQTEQFNHARNTHNLSIPTAHQDLLGSDLAPSLKAAQQLGIKTLIHPYEPPSRWTSPTDARSIAHELNKVSAEAVAGGVSIGYHNHWYEFQEADGTTLYDHFVDALDPRVELQIDTYWLELGKHSSVANIDKYRERITSLHLKDGPISMNDGEHVALGQGIMPIEPILDRSRGTLRVVELDGFAGEDIFDPIHDSFQYLLNFS